MTALCSFDFNKMFDANVYSVACYFLVGSAQMLTEIPQISGAHMSPTLCTGESVLDTPSVCSWAACSSASPQSQKPSPEHHEHILALVTVIAPHPAPPLHSCSILQRNRLPASGGLSVPPPCMPHSQLPLLSGEPVADLTALCSLTHLQQLPRKR